MGEVRFYQLRQRTLERTLPEMLERSLARGWRVVVQGTDEQRMERLSGLLWAREGFLAHGTRADGQGPRQPIWLTTGDDRPNRPDTLFLIEGATTTTAEMSGMEVVAILFNGVDEDALASARNQWREVTAAGLKAVYWAEAEGGGWEKKSESTK